VTENIIEHYHPSELVVVGEEAKKVSRERSVRNAALKWGGWFQTFCSD